MALYPWTLIGPSGSGLKKKVWSGEGEDLERVGVGEGGYHQHRLYMVLTISDNAILYKLINLSEKMC